MSFTPIQTLQTAQQVAANVIRQASQLEQQLTQRYLQAYTAVWHDPNSNSPTDIISAMGTQAAAIFNASAQLATLINTTGGNVPTTSPAGWTVTFNSDGSATAVYTALS